MKIKKYFQNPIFCSIIIFIAAGFFRLLFLNLIEFKLDEAIWVYETTKFFIHPYLVTATFAPISIGLFYFPFPMYVFILLSLVSRQVTVITFFVALFNVLGIVGFYLLSRRIYGNKTALIASLFLSFSPWSILFSRKIWTPDLFLPFAVVFFYSLHAVILKKKSALLLGFFASLLLQIHIPGLVVVVLTGPIVLYILYRRNGLKPFPTKIIIGFLAGFIFAIPYLLRLLFKIGCQGPCLRVKPVYDPFASFDLFHFLRPFEFLTSLNFTEVLGKSYGGFLSVFPFVNFLNVISVLELLICIFGIYYCLTQKKNLRFLVFYVFALPLIFFVTKTSAHMNYYIILSPVMAIFAALGIEFISEKSKNAPFGMGVAIFLILTGIVFESCFYIFLSQKKVVDGDYGPIFSVTKASVERETNPYKDQTFYDEAKAYAYLYPSPNVLHAKMGEYFAQKSEPYFAIDEYTKALKINPRDTASQANLIYIQIVTGDYKDAENGLKVLEIFDSTASANLKKILDQAKDGSIGNQITK